MKPSRDDEPVTYWLCMPDGTCCWDPTEEDYVLWREEMSDLAGEVEYD